MRRELAGLLAGLVAVACWSLPEGAFAAPPDGSTTTVPAPDTTLPPETTLPPDTTLPPERVQLSAPSGVTTGEQYAFSSDHCGDGWTITAVRWFLWGIVRSPLWVIGAQPQPTSPTDISQSADGIRIGVVAGVTARPGPPPPGYDSVTFENIEVWCELAGTKVTLVGETVVFPPNGIAWSQYPVLVAGSPGIASIDVGTRVCDIGSVATLRVLAVPGASGQLSSTVQAAPADSWWISGGTTFNRFYIPYASGPGWATVDYQFSCSSPGGVATSTFHHPDWGLFDVEGFVLPSSGGAPAMLGFIALAAVSVGVMLRRLADRSHRVGRL